MKWIPDTCSCSFEVSISGSDLICTKVLTSCSAHNTGTKQEKLDSCHADNKYKNKCVSQVCEDHAVEAENVKWTFDADMTLDLTCDGLTKTKINNSVAKVIK